MEEGLKHLKTDGITYAAFDTDVTFFDHQPHELTMINGFEDAAHTSHNFGLSKNSEFTAVLDHHLSWLHQSGLYRKMEHKWRLRPSNMGEGWKPNVEPASILGYENLSLPAILMSSGISGSFALVLLEYLFRRVQGNPKK